MLYDRTQDTENEDSLQRFEENIPVLPYYGVDFASLKSISLIIGGETEGISESSYRLVDIVIIVYVSL